LRRRKEIKDSQKRKKRENETHTILKIINNKTTCSLQLCDERKEN